MLVADRRRLERGYLQLEREKQRSGHVPRFQRVDRTFENKKSDGKTTAPALQALLVNKALSVLTKRHDMNKYHKTRRFFYKNGMIAFFVLKGGKYSIIIQMLYAVRDVSITPVAGQRLIWELTGMRRDIRVQSCLFQCRVTILDKCNKTVVERAQYLTSLTCDLSCNDVTILRDVCRGTISQEEQSQWYNFNEREYSNSNIVSSKINY